MHKKEMVRTIFVGVAVIFLFTLLASCGGGGDSGGVAGSTGSITIQYKDSTGSLNEPPFPAIPADGSSSVIIHAEIKDSAGNPVRHYTDVTFSTNLGHFRNGSTTYTMQTQPPLNEKGWPDPSAAPTGIAEATFTAGTTPGVAKVVVRSNNVTQTAYITISGSSAGIKLSADPSTIQADGQSSTTITATLTDSAGSPVKPGTPVTFTTGLGSFVGAGLSAEQQLEAASGSKTYTVITPDSTGIVKVSLIAGLVPGTTYVVATSNDVSQAISIVFTNMHASRISIKADPVYIQADGKSQSVVTATVKDVAGRPLELVPVTFYDATVPTEPSPLPDDNTWKGAASNDHVTPDFYCYSGNVTFTLTYSGSSISNFAVRLWNRDTMKVDSILINTTGPVTGVRVPKTLAAGNYYFQVTAEGEWEIKVEGSIGPAQEGDPKVLGVARTDAKGEAKYTYTSTRTVGIVKIKAETGELSVTESKESLSAIVEIYQTDGPPPIVTITAADDSIYANGAKETAIEVLVLTETGSLAPDGTVVTFSTTAGTLKDASARTIDGKVSTTLIAAVSHSTITATVTATVGANSASATVNFLGVMLYDIQANPATIFANGIDVSKITVRLRDANGVAVVGETITFTANFGTIQTPAVTTAGDGTATTNLIAATEPRIATVMANYGLLMAGTEVVFTSSVPVGTITLTASPASIPADGTSSTIITATLKDTAGKAVPKGTSVTFNTNLGTFSNGSRIYTVITPDETGVVSVSLISGTTAGSATVTASSNNVTQSITVTFSGTVVANITVTATPGTLVADGASTSEIRAEVTDAQGNPIADGEEITFTIMSGTGALSAQSATTSGGFASVTYTAGNTPGNVVIRAMAANNVSGTVTITLTGGGGVAAIALSANPSTLTANGASTSEIRASATDADGNPVRDGETISFAITSGTGTLSANSATTSAGIASVTYTSGTTEGSVVIRAMAANNVSNTVTLTLTSGSGIPASLSLSVSQTSVKSDNSDSSTVTATVLDINNAALEGVLVSFSATGGQLSAASAQTNASGQAQITFSSGTTDRSNRTVTITATVTGLAPQSIPVQIVGSTLTITALKTNLTAGGDPTTLTVTAKDAGGNLVFGAPITLSTSGTQVSVSPPSGNTAVDGTFTSTVTPVTDGSVTVTAVWSVSPQASLAFTIGTTGNVFEIIIPTVSPFSARTRTTASLATTGNNTFIAFVDSNPDTITRSDGGSFAADGYVAGDTIMVGGSTSNDRVFTLAAVTPGTLTLVTADALTAEAAGASVTITNGVLVRVRAPSPTANVVFATSIGVWDGGGSPFVTKAVASGYTWAVLTSSVAGAATVHVYDAADASRTDEKIVSFSIPSGDAAQLTLQSNVYMVAPSIGGTINTATLTATARTSLAAGSQAVSGATVRFSIEDPTGGGETVSPVVSITDSAGQAKSTFTSGAVSSGAKGVTVRAVVALDDQTLSNTTIAFADTNPDTITRVGGSFVTDGFAIGDQIYVSGSTSNDGYYTLAAVAPLTLTLVNADALTNEAAGASVTITHVLTDTISIIIGGTAGSVVIGRGTVIYDYNEATYRLPMSALVTDSNGNAVSGAVVTLAAWPLQYAPGVWYDTDPDPKAELWAVYYTGTFIDNEDANENLILDPGEDRDGDGKLTPASSSAGGVPVPSQVTTGANGVAAFDLIYLKANAAWIKTRIRASTLVLGTETTSSVEMVLPAEEEQAESGLLPDSPFPIGLVTSTAANATYTFPTFRGVAGDTFTTSANLSAGDSYMGVPPPDSNKYDYTYDPTVAPAAVVGNIVWDYITVINGLYGAYFPVRIIIQ